MKLQLGLFLSRGRINKTGNESASAQLISYYYITTSTWQLQNDVRLVITTSLLVTRVSRGCILVLYW
jgi:hypothetical protein